VQGFPDASLTGERIGTFALNVAIIAVIAVGAYGWAGMRRDEVRRFRSQFKSG
jgi:type IV secretory pathway VirB2 component (pilin)